MEKLSKDEAATKKHGVGKAPADGVRPPTSPRSKLKDKGLQAGTAERRYKDMLHTTSHIYQPQVESGLNDTSEEARVSNPSTQTNAKGTKPVREERICPPGSTLPEEITADVPLAKIMSRDQPSSLSVINSDDVSEVLGGEGKTKNIVRSEKNAASEESSVQRAPTESSLVNHEDENGHSTKDDTVTCRKHSNVRPESKPKTPISRPKLCESCTTSMLSYIAVIRDMLDEVTNEITDQEGQTTQCAECVKERVMEKHQIGASTHADHASRDYASQRPHDLPLSKQSRNIGQIAAHDHTAPGASAANEVYQHHQQTRSVGQEQQTRSVGQEQQTRSVGQEQQTRSVGQEQHRAASLPAPETPDSTLVDTRTESGYMQDSNTSQRLPQNEPTFTQAESRRSEGQVVYDSRTDFADAQTGVFNGGESLTDQRSGISRFDTSRVPPQDVYREASESRLMDHSETPDYVSDQAFFGDTLRRSGEDSLTSHHTAATDQRSRLQDSTGDGGRETSSASAGEDYHHQSSPFLRDREETDGILSTLSNEEREVYDSARGRAGWERLTDNQEYRDTSFGPDSTEAFVTMATTNTEALSCLVLGSSLLLCRTTRTLCVLITDGVSPSLRAPLASVFHVVQSVRSLDTVGTTKVALLDQPELGIFFRKLHVWRLVQFSKCVFLNPETLVVQNSDELFCHEELSAVPDIGWPDCFNSGVFVFQPSIETFWKLVEFADSEGSYDGGDQGLLNAFFKTWSKDIHKKLSFIYNLMANVSYTYTPAFKQFGRNVKIVQFQGAFKPWHVKFYTGTGQIAPSTAVHPTYVQFVHVWLNIFRIRVLPLFSQDIQSFASSRNVVCAFELLKFYPSPIEAEPDFLLTPPSVRIRPDPVKFPKQPTIMRRHSIGSDKELRRDQQTSDQEGSKEDKPSEEPPSDQKTSVSVPLDDASKRKNDDNLGTGESPPAPVEEGPSVDEKHLPSTETGKTDVQPVEGSEDDGSRRSSIPGSEIGDYQGMAAWEQGRMDYMGSACSENIIKRLYFLMDKPTDSDKPE